MRYLPMSAVIGAMALTLLGAAQDSEQPKQDKPDENKTYTSVKLIADFEDGVDDLDTSMSAVKKKPKIESVEEAKEGKKACKITYSASPADRKDKDWTLIKCAIESWPAEGDHLSFWIKAGAEKTEVRVKLSEMKGDHTEFEGFKFDLLDVGAEWKQVRIPLTSFEYLWGHSKDKTLQKEKISNVDFAQPDMTKGMTIFIDQIEIVREDVSKKAPEKN